jgi:tetratricopeptide (TPR) repeat protein
MFDFFGGKDPERAYQKAQEYIREERIDAAIKILESNLTDSEDSFDLYLLLARLHFNSEERDRAMQVVRSAKAIVPARTDEITALVSELYYQHASIDTGDFLLEIYIEQKRYDEISKVLRMLSEREIQLLITRYDKYRQAIDKKKIISTDDANKLIMLASARFYANDSEAAVVALDSISEGETFVRSLLEWARVVARERYADWRAQHLLIKMQIACHDFHGALNQAQRTTDKFPESVVSVIGLIGSTKPPKDLKEKYTKFITDLHIRKGDLSTSIELLLSLETKDKKKVDDVIKGLRELERINPNNIRILYALADTYIGANRLSLAVSELDKILETDATQYDEVVARYQKAFDTEPSNPQVIEGLVNTFLKNGEFEDAVDVIEKSYQADPGHVDEYIAQLNAILEKKLDNPKALYLMGLCYARKNDHESASVIFDSLLDRGENQYVYDAVEEIQQYQPDDPHYLPLRARSMIALGKAEPAFAVLTDYIEQNPEETGTFLPTFDAIIREKPELTEKILPIYQRYSQIQPFVSKLATARAYAFAEDYERAVKLFEQLLDDEENKGAVKRALIETIQERPKAVPLLLAAARVFMKEGEVEIATRFFKTAQMVDPKAFFEIVDEFYDALKTFPKDREVRTLLVEAFFSRKLWNRVVEETKRAIEVFGRKAQFFNLRLGEALVEDGNLSDAVRPLMLSLDGDEDYSGEVLEYLEKILSIDKSNVPAHFARGRALSRAHRVEEAVEEYLLTVRILPARAEYVHDELKSLSEKAVANPDVIFAMGTVELVLEKYSDAVKHLQQSCELDDKFVKNVIPLFERLIQNQPSPQLEFAMAKVYHIANFRNTAVNYYIRAQSHDRNLRERAISEIKKICAEDKTDVESAKGLAQLYLDFSNHEDALDLINQIYSLNPREGTWAKNFVAGILQKNHQHIPSYYLLAKIFLDDKKFKKSVEVYERLLEMTPAETTRVVSILNNIKEKDADILLFLGSLYKATGELHKALSLFNDLFTLDPAYGNAINHHIKEILKKNTNVGDAYLLAHKIFMYNKEYDKAVEAIHRAKELHAGKEEVILQEGQTYYAMGDPEKAIRLYTDLLTTTKDKKSIYRLIKDTRDKYFNEKIALIKGDDDRCRLERAHLYLMVNKPSMAEKELKFVPQNRFSMKKHSILKARLYLVKHRPLDALEIMKTYTPDEETATIYADIYEALGSFEAAARVLREAGSHDVVHKIAVYEKLAQERRLAKGRYIIEGRS